MDQTPFASPVHVVTGRDERVAEIGCARDAFEYLQKARVQEGPIFESAMEACFAAMHDAAFAKDAQLGLAAYAKAYRLLAKHPAERARH